MNCKDCPNDENDKLFEELWSGKKSGINGAPGTAAASGNSKNETKSSVIFSATFCKKVRPTVCADIGADATLMGRAMLEQIKKAEIDLQLEKLTPPRTFNMAARDPDGSATTICYDKAATIGTQLHIRHGSARIVRGLRWLFTRQTVGEPLLGRPVLEVLGLHCHKVLAAAVDRLGGIVDVSALVGNQSDFVSGRIGRVLDGVFHADGGAGDADLDDSDGWHDLGPEDPPETERVPKAKL